MRLIYSAYAHWRPLGTALWRPAVGGGPVGSFSLLALPSIPFLGFHIPGTLLPVVLALFSSLPKAPSHLLFPPPQDTCSPSAASTLSCKRNEGSPLCHAHGLCNASFSASFVICVQLPSSSCEMAQAFGH